MAQDCLYDMPLLQHVVASDRKALEVLRRRLSGRSLNYLVLLPESWVPLQTHMKPSQLAL